MTAPADDSSDSTHRAESAERTHRADRAPGDEASLLDAHDRERWAERRHVLAAGSLAVVMVAATVTGVSLAAATPREVPTLAAPPSATATAPLPPASTIELVDETPTPTETPTPSPTDSANAALAGDITTASSLTVLVNKLTPLNPIDYAPDDLVRLADLGVPSLNDHSLRAPAAAAVQQLFAAASAAGYTLDMTSGYRSSESQTALYDGYVGQLGQAGADATSARPGYSEHQTGLAADISAPAADCPLEQCFADTAEGRWLAEHAWEHGFILRYPHGATSITGYEFEPWHYRYVGVDVSTAMHEQGIATYEEFLGAPAAPDYAA